MIFADTMIKFSASENHYRITGLENQMSYHQQAIDPLNIYLPIDKF